MSSINTKPLYQAKGELIDAGIVLNRSKDVKHLYLNDTNTSQTVLNATTKSLDTTQIEVQYSKTKSNVDIDIEMKNTVDQTLVGNIQVPRTLYLAAGNDTQNKMLWSYDGKKDWVGSTNIFSSNAYSVASNGSLWIASGEGSQNTLAYSFDGYVWEGLGNSIFTQESTSVAYYNNMWVAVGKSTNTIAYSTNGFEWTGLGMRFSNAGLCLKHNGSRWLAGGDSAGNSFAYSDDGISWTTVDCSLNVVRDIAYSDSVIIAVGDKTDTSWQNISDSIPDWNGSFEDDDLTPYLTSSQGYKKLGDDGPATLTGWAFTTGSHATSGPTLFRGNTYNSGDPPLHGQQSIGLRYGQEISKIVSGLIIGKVYKISWQRHIRQDDQPSYCILLDTEANILFSETPSSPVGASTIAERYKDVTFVATAIVHTIKFKHLVSTDKTVYIDNVELYLDLDSRNNMAYSQDNGITWTPTLISNVVNVNGIAKGTDTWVALGQPHSSTPTIIDLDGLNGWFDGSSLDVGAGLWKDKSGKENHETLIRPDLWAKEQHVSGQNSANAVFDYAAGSYESNSNAASVEFTNSYVRGEHTIFHVFKYPNIAITGANAGYSIAYTDENGSMGHSDGYANAYRESLGWISSYNDSTTAFFVEGNGYGKPDTYVNNWNITTHYISDDELLFRPVLMDKTVTMNVSSKTSNQKYPEGYVFNGPWNKGAMNIAAVLIYNRKLTTGEIEGVETYLKDFYINGTVSSSDFFDSPPMMYSQDILGISNWTDISNSLLSSSGHKVIWNGQKFIAVGEGNTNTVLISDDGINWTGKGSTVLPLKANQISYDGTKLVAGGANDSTGNNMAYSLDDGTNWFPLNSTTSIFSGKANDTEYNGTHWIATGEGLVNTLAISRNGQKWKGLGKTTFSVRGNSVYFDERTSKWVALGEGTNTIAYSYNSYFWTGLGTTIFSVQGKKTVSNGSIWVAVGEGTNTLAYSYDGINWTGLGTSVFSVRGNDVVWSGVKWNVVGEGTNTMAYSYDGINWETNVTNNVLTNRVNSIGYFNNMWVAGGDGVSGTKPSSAINPAGSWNALGTVFEAERVGDQLGNAVSLSGNGTILAIASSYNDPPIGGVDPAFPRMIETIAGTGSSGYSGDGGAATSAQINTWVRAFSIYNNCMYIGDLGNSRIRKIDLSTNIITTVAGNGQNSYSGDGGLAINAAIGRPEGFGVDKFGNMFIASNGGGGSYKMRRVDVNTGIIELYAGDGTAGNSGDGGLPINARIGLAYQIDFDSENNMYFSSYNHGHIRRIDYQTQIVSTIMTGLGIVIDIAIDMQDNVYEVGYDHKLRKWDKTTNQVTVLAGSSKGVSSSGLQDPSIGDGGDASSAKFNHPSGVAVASNGDIYISDSNNVRIRKIDAITNIISTVVGDGYGATSSGVPTSVSSGDGGDPSDATLRYPQNIGFDEQGRLYIADYGKIRRAYFPSTHIANAGHVRLYQNSAGSWAQVGSDIDGTVENDFTGTSVSLSYDGTTVATGVIGHSGTGLTNNGCVRVYKKQMGDWVQIGSDIEGDSTNDNFGISVAISQFGTILAIGATNYQGGNNGYVKIYEKQSGVWNQIGSTIVGSGASDRLGNTVSISLDGSIVAIGAKDSTTVNGTQSGEVSVYKNIAGTWTQFGNSIVGSGANENLGYSVSLSGNGQILAVGANNGDIIQTDSGHISIYQYVTETTSWEKLGNDIVGYESNEHFGSSLSLSSDGTTVVAGSYNSDVGGTDIGYVKAYKLIEGYWRQIGRKLVGQTAGDKFGFSVSTNSDGSKIGVGSTGFDNNSGSVSTYQIQNAYMGGEVGIGHTLAYSRDGIEWTGLNADVFSSQAHSVYHNGEYWVAGGEGNNTMAYSASGTTWTPITETTFGDSCMSLKSNRNIPSISLKGDVLAFGKGTNTIAKSKDGISWTGKGASVFTEYGKNGFWNGKMWVAVGKGTNTLATSIDGGETWSGKGTSVFSIQGNDVIYGDDKWVAVGSGIHKFAHSTDGITWTGVDNAVFVSQANKIAFNGLLWVAVGKGGNTIATSTDGINWTGRGKTIFSIEGNGIVWTGSVWVATGSGTNTIAYSSDGIVWTGLSTLIFSLQGNGVSYNGDLIVATGKGTNTIACSVDGIHWVSQGALVFSEEGISIDWTGEKWIATGIGNTTTLAYSSNGFVWTGQGKTVFTIGGNGISSNNPIQYNRHVNQIFEEQILFSTSSNLEGDVSIKVEY